MASPREIRQTRETRSRLIAQDGATRKLTIKSGGTKRVGAFRASIHKSPNGAAGMEGASICNYQHKMLEDFELHTRQKNPKDCQYHKIHEAGTNPVPSLHPDRGQPPRPDPALSCWPLAIISCVQSWPQASMDNPIGISSSLISEPRKDFLSLAKAQLGFMNMFAITMYGTM
ncbi:hypothetical protein PG991_013069 [Apiospora marii]|uniref:Uncharacterized protein n=1 Tax=Apiospora marii TaxID=335849 RepID=A0ABR1R531_9PEZI